MNRISGIGYTAFPLSDSGFAGTFQDIMYGFADDYDWRLSETTVRIAGGFSKHRSCHHACRRNRHKGRAKGNLWDIRTVQQFCGNRVQCHSWRVFVFSDLKRGDYAMQQRNSTGNACGVVKAAHL
ncbi:MAG: hypothetical protein LBJ12_09855 [Oscillospiraceae bacterium]|jgi:hypothetical protein|nr:hypothetical protein [Oscillospiraceae bacterium]